jgi:hypothetical protein
MQAVDRGAHGVVGARGKSREPAVGDFEVEVEELLRVRVFTEVCARVEGCEMGSATDGRL